MNMSLSLGSELSQSLLSIYSLSIIASDSLLIVPDRAASLPSVGPRETGSLLVPDLVNQGWLEFE